MGLEESASSPMITVKCGSRTATPAYDAIGSAAELHACIRKSLDIAEDAAIRVMHRGHILPDGPDSLISSGLNCGSKVLVMFSSALALSAAASARPERMRSFEEDDQRTRTGGLGPSVRGGEAPRKTQQAPSQYRFHALDALQVSGAAKPGREVALQRLRELSTDPAICAILAEHRWSVGILKEMPPEGLVGVSSSCLMGLNRNRGQEIILRLRTDNMQGLRPLAALVPVLLHELTHNVHDEHDDQFKALNSQLSREYALHRSRLGRGATVSGTPSMPAAEPEDYVPRPDGHAVGGSPDATLRPRDAAAQAAITRAAAAAAAALPAASRASIVVANGVSDCVECEGTGD